MSSPATPSPRRTSVRRNVSLSGAPRTCAPGPSSSSLRPRRAFLKRTASVPQVSGAQDAQIYAGVSLAAEPWSEA